MNHRHMNNSPHFGKFTKSLGKFSGKFLDFDGPYDHAIRYASNESLSMTHWLVDISSQMFFLGHVWSERTTIIELNWLMFQNDVQSHEAKKQPNWWKIMKFSVMWSNEKTVKINSNSTWLKNDNLSQRILILGGYRVRSLHRAGLPPRKIPIGGNSRLTPSYQYQIQLHMDHVNFLIFMTCFLSTSKPNQKVEKSACYVVNNLKNLENTSRWLKY